MQKRVIRIAQSFQKTFEKDFKKHDITIKILVKKLTSIPLIWLRSPFVKIKCYLGWLSVRGVAIKKPKENILLIVPIFVVKKTNKQQWDNIILSKKILSQIDHLFSVYQKEFEKWEYREYK